MLFKSLRCFKMSETCLGEISVQPKRRKTRRGKRLRNPKEKRIINEALIKKRRHLVAPSNTTQFIMEDHEKIEPILNFSPTSSLSSHSADDEPSDVDFRLETELDSFNEQFFLKDFEATYRQLHRENLYSLSKLELLQKVKDLETHRDVLEKERHGCVDNMDQDRVEKELLKGKLLQLKVENSFLKEENEELKKKQGKDVNEVEVATHLC